MLTFFEEGERYSNEGERCKENPKGFQDEEEDTNAGMLEGRRPSFFLAVGGIIDPGGGTLVFSQEVPTYQLIQGMHEILAHFVSRLMHSQGLNQNVDLKQRHVTV